MTKKLLLIVALFAFSLNIYPQDSITKKTWIVKWNAIAAIDVFTFPTIQLGVEKKLNDYFSVQAEFGIQVNDNDDYKYEQIVKQKGFKINSEGRWYLFRYLKKDHSSKLSNGLYTGVQLFYRQNQYNSWDEYDYLVNEDENEYATYRDTYAVIKKVYGVTFTMGFQKIFLKNFVFEPHAGIGIMNRNFKNIGRDILSDEYELEATCFDFRPSDHESNSGGGINITVGIRLGYRF